MEIENGIVPISSLIFPRNIYISQLNISLHLKYNFNRKFSLEEHFKNENLFLLFKA